MTRVFVYGTLLSGQCNHRLLRTARFLGAARTTPRFQMHSLGLYPGVVEGGSQAIAGELYEVDETGVAMLDRLEGHPDFYRRTVIELDDGAVASTYLLPYDHVAHRPVIVSGSWLDYRRNQQP